MSEAAAARGGEPRLTGVVDTLSAGYGVINRRPWIILIPVLLDLLLWFGPRVSVAPLLGPILSQSGIRRGLGPDEAQAFDSARQAILAAADDANLLALVSPGWISVPVIVPLLARGGGTFSFVTSWTNAIVVSLGALLGGALLGCVYRGIIAQQVRGEAMTPMRLAREALRAWMRLIGVVLLLGAGGLLLSVPLLLVVVGATLLARDLGAFGVAFIVGAALWAQVYLFFASDAVFVSRVGPLQAVRRSVGVVRAHFWAALRIVVLITIIVLGMNQVWVSLATRVPWGLALGIVGNAYIASGLVAASMLFYRERVRALPYGRGLTPSGKVEV